MLVNKYLCFQYFGIYKMYIILLRSTFKWSAKVRQTASQFCLNDVYEVKKEKKNEKRKYV